MANVADLNDKVGIPGVGTTSDSSTESFGDNWQFGIAVDINNRKFEFGKVIKYNIAADDYDVSEVEQNTHQIGISHTSQDINSSPSNFIQYGDKALLGPSTFIGHEGYGETIRISTAAQDTDSSTDTWNNGLLYSLDRKNKYKYQLSDSITIKGTGQGAGWVAQNACMGTLGYMHGYSSLGEMGRYSVYANANTEDHILAWENSFGDDFIGLKIMLPNHGSYDPAANTNDPAIYNSTRGLAPWRDPNAAGLSVGDIDWENDTPGYKGVFRYVRSHNDDSDYALLAYNSNVIATGTIENNNTYAPLLTGFVHDGGEFSPYAQCLFTMVNNLSNTYGAAGPQQESLSTGIFTQYLTRSINDSQDMSYAKLIPNVYYRLGITWKGDVQGIQIGQSTKTFAKFQWGPTAGTGDVNHYEASMITTAELMNAASPTQAVYKTDMVSGYVGPIDTDDLDTSHSNLKIDIVQQAASWNNSIDLETRNRGAEVKTFVDNIWLEHEGDVPNGSGKGYIEINHHPAQGTLQFQRYQASKPKTIKLADGSSETIDPTGASKRWLYEIKASFNYVNSTVWSQFKRLMQWQDKGYKLTLHPFLPEVPHCLVGELTIKNIKKSFWDLDKFTFQVLFRETD
jgi:hypothetical protein